MVAALFSLSVSRIFEEGCCQPHAWLGSGSKYAGNVVAGLRPSILEENNSEESRKKTRRKGSRGILILVARYRSLATGFAAPLRFFGIKRDSLTAITAQHSRWNAPGVPSNRLMIEEISINQAIADAFLVVCCKLIDSFWDYRSLRLIYGFEFKITTCLRLSYDLFKRCFDRWNARGMYALVE